MRSSTNINQFNNPVSSLSLNKVRRFIIGLQENGDVYSEKDFNLILYSYPADNPACQTDSNSPNCPRTNVAQEAIDIANKYASLIVINL